MKKSIVTPLSLASISLVIFAGQLAA